MKNNLFTNLLRIIKLKVQNNSTKIISIQISHLSQLLETINHIFIFSLIFFPSILENKLMMKNELKKDVLRIIKNPKNKSNSSQLFTFPLFKIIKHYIITIEYQKLSSIIPFIKKFCHNFE